MTNEIAMEVEVEASDFVSQKELHAILACALRAHSQLSDINFTVGRLPQIEVDGQLREVALGDWNTPLTAFETEVLTDAIFDDDESLKETLTATGSADCALELEGGNRFRVNVFKSRDCLSIVLRVLPSEVPSIERLDLPKIIEEIPQLKDGLVLVSGATGSGKSTTLAAIVNRINETRPVHIVTLEDPVEFVHRHLLGTVNQREMERDFFEFSSGLRAALRQAPKVILVGEMRDRETMEIALKAAETGHLVLSTIHTIRPGDAINRIAGMFDGSERDLVRTRLASVLRFVVGQRLLPKAGGGRIAAIEVLGSNLRVRNLIEYGENEESTFSSVIDDNRPRGWQTFDHHIVEHLEAAKISMEVAQAYSVDRSAVSREIDRIKTLRGQPTSDLGELEMDNGSPDKAGTPRKTGK
jgi:twitching motility protein PilT